MKECINTGCGIRSYNVLMRGGFGEGKGNAQCASDMCCRCISTAACPLVTSLLTYTPLQLACMLFFSSLSNTCPAPPRPDQLDGPTWAHRQYTPGCLPEAPSPAFRVTHGTNQVSSQLTAKPRFTAVQSHEQPHCLKVRAAVRHRS